MLLRALVHRPQCNRGRGAGFAGRGPCFPPSGLARRVGRCRDDGVATRKTTSAGSTNSSTFATRRGPPVMPDSCTAPERDARRGDVVTSYYPHHGWTNHVRRAIAPSPSLDYSPVIPLHTPTPADPPEFLLRGTIAARCGAPPFYMAVSGSSSSVLALPYPPPAPLFPNRPTTAAAANACPSLHNIIKTEHVPAKTRGSGKASRPPPSGERVA
uniref:Uncharacterized protein n=1 Tax=Oryza punctata TaxID=4537 RepID=A0A0E0KMW7_ORYPU